MLQSLWTDINGEGRIEAATSDNWIRQRISRIRSQKDSQYLHVNISFLVLIIGENSMIEDKI